MTDIAVKLISPSGTIINLFSHKCGDADDAAATFADNGVILSCNETPVISGTIKPETLLSTLAGESSFGVWQLEVYDEFQLDLVWPKTYAQNL